MNPPGHQFLLLLLLLLAVVGPLGGCASSPPTFSVTSGPPLPQGRGGHAAGLVDGQIVVTGGTNWTADKQTKFWLHETVVLEDGTWRAGPALPYPGALAAFAHDAIGLYVAGAVGDARGIGALRLPPAPEIQQPRRVFRLSGHDSGATWQELAPLPRPTTAAAGAILDGTFYIFGGVNSEGVSKQMFALDTADPAASWRRCADLPGPARALATLASGGGSLYLLGGADSWEPLNPMRDTYRYDPKRDKWQRMKDLPWPSYAMVGGLVDERRILLTGRVDRDGIHKGIWLFDLANGDCLPVGEAIVPAATAALVRVSPNEWWVIGGEPDLDRNRAKIVTIIRRRAPQRAQRQR